jgi:hypothetical protein
MLRAAGHHAPRSSALAVCILLMASLALAGCSSPGANEPRAESGSPSTTASSAAPATTGDGRDVEAVPLAGVVGVVVDMDTGEPVAGASVSAGGGATVSGPDGRFVLKVPLAVGAPVLAEKDGYIAAERLAGPNRGDGYGECQLELLLESSPNAPPVAPSS